MEGEIGCSKITGTKNPKKGVYNYNTCNQQ